MKKLWRFAFAALFGVAALGPHRGAAQQKPFAARLDNFDRRSEQVHAAAPVALDRARAIAELRQRVPDISVDVDRVSGAPGFIRARDGFLSGPGGVGRAVPATAHAGLAAADPHRSTKAFLNEHRALFGHGAEALATAKLQREFTSPRSQARTFVWQQEVDGVPVFEALLISHETKNAALISISSQFVPEPTRAADAGAPNRAALAGAPPVSASQAAVRAAKDLGERLTETAIRSQMAPDGADKRQRFSANGLPGEIHARLVWLPLSSTRLRLCWEIILTGRIHPEMYRVLVDAETGEVWLRRTLTAYDAPARYRVWVSDSPSPFSPGHAGPAPGQPPLVSRVLVITNALNTNASPLGWISDGDNETRGNNVEAHTDTNADDQPDLPRPQGTPAGLFDFPIDLTQPPASYSDAAVVQLFYWCNWMHDQLYDLGFTEAAGNFQMDNFGRGGAGNDPLQADAQDGSGFDNANMSTPPDGLPPRMQMFLFTGPEPDRDGDFDAEVILHEYTHGLSNRRVGGGVGISALQSAGMGEGWSDFYGLALLSEPADDVDGAYAAGGYLSYLLGNLMENYYFGIRRYPYSTDLAKNPLTFKDIDPNQALPHTGVPLSPLYAPFSPFLASEVHAQGEVWCVTLWEARANLIKKHGFAIGNRLILQLVTDGMNLSPANPNFLEARDAILLADHVNNNGANQNELWAAFARRGMGVSATSPPSSTTTGVRESFDAPDDLAVTPLTDWIARGPVGGPFSPPSQTYTLTNVSTNTVAWTASRSAGWFNVTPASGLIPPGGAAVPLSVVLDNTAFSLPAGLYMDTVFISNATTRVVQSRRVTLNVGTFDSFTESFESGDNDLDFKSFTFTPDGSAAFYSVCSEPVTGFFTDPAGGTLVLTQSFGANTQLTVSANISLYGHSTNVIFVGSSGYITLDAGDSSAFESLPTHFFRRRISGLFTALYPFAGGSISWKQVADRVAVSYVNVPELFYELTNSFQIELFFDGRIRLTFLAIGTTNGIAGLSRGNGLPPGFEESDFSAYPACRPPIALTLPAAVTEGMETLVGQGVVRLAGTSLSSRTVNLASSDLTELIVPASVVVPAGETEALFNLTVPDDKTRDGTQIAVVTATAAGHQRALARVQVFDSETASLSLTLSPGTTEGMGVITGRVSMNVLSPAGIAVSLESSDTNELLVPSVVIIPAGSDSVEINATVIDDTRLDGPQNVTVSAHVANWTGSAVSVAVADNDPTTLALILPRNTREGRGTLTNAGLLRLAGTLPTNLVVALVSLDTTELTVPAVVVVPAGEFSVRFDLAVVDETDVDGTQPVVIEANAPGFTTGTASIDVFDDETPLPPAFPSPPHLAGNVPVTADLSWFGGEYTELLANGGFETGDFTGWVRMASAFGNFEINTATNDPPSPDGPLPPFEGDFSAIAEQLSAGSHEMYQDVALPAGAQRLTLNWADRVRNFYGDFSEFQQYRVEIRTTNNVLRAVAHSTMPGDLSLGDWVTRSFDLTPFAGETVRVAFVANPGGFHLGVHVDSVSVAQGLPGNTTFDIYFGTNPTPGPGEFFGTTTNTFWDLPRLAPGVTYHWQIVARTLGSMAGPIWQFTTRGVDRFEWAPVASPQIVNQAFGGTLTAKDSFGTTVSNFSGAVRLEALGTSAPVTRFGDDFEDGDLNGWVAGTGPFVRTVTSNTAAGGLYSLSLLGGANQHRSGISHSLPNLTPDEVRFAIRSSRSDAAGGYVNLGVGTNLSDIAVYFYLNNDGRMNLVEESGGYHAAPYVANRWYDVRFRFSWTNRTVDFYVDGVLIERGVPFRGTNISRLSGIWLYNYEFTECWWDNIQFLTDGQPARFAVAPTNITGFADGVWTGPLTLSGPAEGVSLRASDGQGHSGTSGPFDVVESNDLLVRVEGSPDPAAISSEITYDVSALNSGPSVATGVVLTNHVPAGAALLGFTGSQGQCTLGGGEIICDFGSLSAGATARLTVVVAPSHFGLFTNRAVVTRDGPDAVPANNTAVAVVAVAPPLLTLSDAVVPEGQSGATFAGFQLTLSATSALPVTVTFLTTNGTAVAGSDFVAAAGTLTFPPGSTQQTLHAQINGDITNETDEAFFVLLRESHNASIVRQRAVGVILNDDHAAVASMPFSEDWESGGFRPYWLATGTPNFRSQVIASNEPHGGRFHLTMDNGTNNFIDTRNEVTLFIDMEGWTNVQLRFWAVEFFEFADGPPPSPFYGGADFDGVAVSMDGVRWYEAQGLRTLSSVYSEWVVELDAVVRAHGLAYTPTFRVRFNEFGPFSLPFGGLGIDDISITGRPAGIAPAGVELLVESCANTNGAIDPGERVTVNLSLANAGLPPTANLTATLLSGGGVFDPSGPQDYGTLRRGAVAGRPFSFSAGGTCGGILRATLRLQDGTTDLGQAVFQIPLGVAQTNVTVFRDMNAVTIPASGAATPYPASNVVSGISASVQKVTVTLHEISHPAPDHLDVLLVGPLGQAVELFSDCGGSNAITGVTLTLDSTVALPLPDDAAIAGGTHAPGNYGSADFFPSPAPPSPWGTDLGVFNGLNPNGIWRLFVYDDTFPQTGSIAGGWSIAFDTVGTACCTDAGSVDLGLRINDAPDPVAANRNVVYTFLINNRGPSAATGVVLTNPLPPVVSFLSASPSQGSCTNDNGTVRCSLGTLPTNITAFVTMTVRALTPGYITNSAGVTSIEGDLNGLDNPASAITAVTPPAVLLQPVLANETSVTNNSALFNVRLSYAITNAASVQFDTIDLTAQAGFDYVGTNGQLIFLPGESNKTITVTILPDVLDEAAESFLLNFHNPVNLIVNTSSVACTIIDNDPGATLSIGDVTILEGNAGLSPAVFDVRLSPPSGQRVQANFATVNLTALAPSDYITTTGVLVFPAGATNLTVSVPVRGDLTNEASETFAVNLTGVTGGLISDSQGICTLLNDDLLPTVIAVGMALVTESCLPTNRVVDPDETVSVSFTLRNASTGGAIASNLTATLLPAAGVVAPGAPQNYGTLFPGSQATRTNTFTAGGRCGDTVRAVLSLEANGQFIGTVTSLLTLGRGITPLAQRFDTETAPNLPPGWTATAIGSTTPWRTVSTVRDTVPNSAFAGNPSSRTTNDLTSPPFLITRPDAQFSFRHNFDTEPGFDGGTLLYSTNAVAFTDIIAAGGRFLAGGYNDTINFDTPAWSGNSTGWVSVAVALPASAAGKNVTLRWRMYSDSSVGAVGWYVDTITILDGYACCEPPPLRLTTIRIDAGLVALQWPAIPGRVYRVQFKGALDDAAWTDLPGDVPAVEPAATKEDVLDPAGHRFYRVVELP